jgi:hypothetical protein
VHISLASRTARIASLTFVEPLGGRLDLVAAARHTLGAQYGDRGSDEHRQDVIEQDGRTTAVALLRRFWTR